MPRIRAVRIAGCVLTQAPLVEHAPRRGRGVDASAAARRVFDQADEVLGFPLSRLCFQGPSDELEDTINAQPAILTVSIAALEALKERLAEAGQKVDPNRGRRSLAR